MSRICLTRQDSREQTRQHLLEAAATVIADRGLVMTTVEDIVEQAGYTRGAFYSNFDNKFELFVEWLNAHQAEIKNSLHYLLDACIRAAPYRNECDHGDRNLMLWIEARHHAMRDVAFRHQLHALTLQLRNAMACFIDDYCSRMHVRPSMNTDALALVVMALIEGSLCVQINMPTEMPGESLYAILHRFFAVSVFGNGAPCPPRRAPAIGC